ncbi:hypothetical protein V7S43_011343 [Phytophthora oleae]|uniref:Uncharacterized protein n=1 Tax=Phytophthora oleae TaxID=2107226 RepID=A0ABD3FEN6_9STRA
MCCSKACRLIEACCSNAIPPESPSHPLVPVQDAPTHDDLSESDPDDEDDEADMTRVVSMTSAGAVPKIPPVAAVPSLKRGRSEREELTDDVGSLVTLRETFASNPAMVRQIDRLISLNQSDEVVRGVGQGVSGGSTAGTLDGSAQFRPTAIQRRVHGYIVNGTYARMGFQLLVESLQVSLQSFDILPHPAVICGFIGWEFGLRGLSVMHFASLSDVDRRQRSQASDMADFSRKNKLPKAPPASDLAALCDALSGLATVAQLVSLPFVVTLVEKAHEFVSKLARSKLSRSFSVPETRMELIHWVDERLETVRLLLAQNKLEPFICVSKRAMRRSHGSCKK